MPDLRPPAGPAAVPVRQLRPSPGLPAGQALTADSALPWLLLCIHVRTRKLFTDRSFRICGSDEGRQAHGGALGRCALREFPVTSPAASRGIRCETIPAVAV